MVICTTGFMIIEGVSLTDALYFSIVTISTVGYGDIYPATKIGKLLSIFLIIFGVGTFLGVIANAAEMLFTKREKQIRLEKLNMVIGVFFSEVGTKLLALFSNYDPNVDTIRKELIIQDNWTKQDFLVVSKRLKKYDYEVDMNKVDLEILQSFLLKKRDFLLRLLENSSLLEHESFTEFLRAVFHLTEELAYREDISKLPYSDKVHLVGDIKRAYNLIVSEWLDYMEHLKNNSPYLFSLAMRINPFDLNASPIVDEHNESYVSKY